MTNESAGVLIDKVDPKIEFTVTPRSPEIRRAFATAMKYTSHPLPVSLCVCEQAVNKLRRCGSNRGRSRNA